MPILVALSVYLWWSLDQQFPEPVGAGKGKNKKNAAPESGDDFVMENLPMLGLGLAGLLVVFNIMSGSRPIPAFCSSGAAPTAFLAGGVTLTLIAIYKQTLATAGGCLNDFLPIGFISAVAAVGADMGVKMQQLQAN